MPLRSAALFLLTLCASAQTIRPSFEVASVRPSAPSTTRTPSGIRVTGHQISIGRMPMKQIIRTAYGVPYDRIEGPAWSAALGNLSYDIEATMPAGIRASQLPQMLQSLLEERFKLKAHWGTKIGDYYAVVVGKEGAKFTKVNDDPADFSKFDWGTTNADNGVKVFQSGSTKTWTEPSGLNRVQMSTLADVATLLYPHFGGVPVVDKTGLQGTYEIKLQYTISDLTRAQAEGELTRQLLADEREQVRAGVISGVEKLGLKIEKQKGEIEVLMIDQLDKIPTEN